MLFRLWLYFSLAVSFGTLAFSIAYIAAAGGSEVSWEFISAAPSGLPLGTAGGILPAILGSLALTLLAVLTALLLALPTALFNIFYCSSLRLRQLVEISMRCLAGVPSIVLGLFGYAVFVREFSLGRSLLAGALVLGLMIFPFIELRLERLLAESGRTWQLSSAALGVSRLYMLRRVLLPYIRGDILRTLAQGAALAMGAAAPLLLTAAVLSAPAPQSLLSPVMALPVHLYILASEGLATERAYATALVLLALVGIINLAVLAGCHKEGAGED